MRLKSLLIPSLLRVCAGGAAAAQSYLVTVQPAGRPDGYQKLERAEAVIGTTPLVIWRNYALNPDCTPTGSAQLRVVHTPEHGTVTISDEPFYPNYPRSNVRFDCDKQRVPGNRAIYTAAAGFNGHDRVVLEGTTGSGVVNRIAIDITVR